MNVSPHFTLDELTFSQTALRLGIDNTPGPPETANLERLCATLLEPLRGLLGVALHVDSGYRCPDLNTRVGGALTSAHVEGRAADLIPIGMPMREAFDRIRWSGLPYDQLIGECGFAWIHVAVAKDGVAPRGQCLTASGGPGNWNYQEVA